MKTYDINLGKKIILPCLALMACCATASTSVAATSREHGSHVHGVGNLNIVIDANMVHLELISPAANIVGFEHDPVDDVQKAQLEKAIHSLEDPEKLFTFSPDAECQAVAVSLGGSMIADEHDHEEHDGEHGHKDEHHHDAADHEHEDHSDHKDIEASYQFKCGAPEKLEQLELKFFTEFKAFGKVRLQMFSPNGQQGGEMSPTNNTIKF